MKNNWEGINVLIIGAARQGLALARYLSTRSANVTLNDNRPAEALSEEIKKLKDFPVQWFTGSHPLSLLDGKDLVAVSGGVPLDIPLVQEAKARGITLTNDTQIFMESVPCPVIGITGSAGKTTVTSLLGEMAKLAIKSPEKAWVGGNIGTPLIEFLDQIKPNDTVVLELSSFQLELMNCSPDISAITNITPNHLDRHENFQAYTAAKAHILQFQSDQDIAILNRQDPVSWKLKTLVRGKLFSYGMNHIQNDSDGTFFEGDILYLQQDGQIFEICSKDLIQLRGSHNLMNVLCACTLAAAAGFPINAMTEAIQSFKGVEHRLEFVREYNGAKWYNDSIATAPERTIAAINSFDEPIVLLLGGKDKNLPWEDLANLVHQRVDHVIVFGEASEKILKALGSQLPDHRPFTIQKSHDLQQAVLEASKVTESGDVVLLSPGGTSYDAFTDFAERGEHFRLWVNQLP
jgi:UDP-N-acetylmuramoylalanine--D-glutamate ligase